MIVIFISLFYFSAFKRDKFILYIKHTMIDLIIKASRADLKDNSLKIYLSALRKLNNNQPVTSIEFMKDFEGIMEKLKDKSSNTK
eukprot:SAG11_NODE_9873_length_873_cov_4.003876_1_plen_84_part_10